jgi:hypothetical protein
MRVALIAISSLLVIACGEDEPTPAQTDAPDTSGAETTPDSAEPDDSDTADDSDDADDTADDSDDADDTADDTANDVDDADDTANDVDDADDTADTDTAETTCEYFEERELLRCGPNNSNTQVLKWISVDAVACPPYYTRGEDRYETLEALATAESCDADCVFRARISVDFIRCDGQGRSGYDVYESADEEACGTPLYYTSDGIFPDLCFWSVYACYCEEE